MWSFPEKISLIEDELKGRCILAKRDIQEGETIIREEPYCYILFKEYKDDICDYCFNYINILQEKSKYPIKCKDCKKINYCSESCMYKSEELHKFECTILSSVIIEDIAKNCGVTFDRTRLLIRFVFQILNELSRNENQSTIENSFLTSNYHQINSLIDNKENFSEENIEIYKNLSMQILEISKIKEKINKNFLQDYINHQLLIKILCIIDSNSFGIPMFSIASLENKMNRSAISSFLLYKSNNKKPKNSLELAHSLLSPNITGWGLFSYSSLFNHSCDPNSSFIGTNETSNGKLIIEIKANRKILKNEEITINYIELYESRRNRIRSLFKTKYFYCQCQRCTCPYKMSKDFYLESYVCTKCFKNYDSIITSNKLNNHYDNNDYCFLTDDQEYLISQITDVFKCNYCNEEFSGSEIIHINNEFLNTIQEAEYLNNEKHDLINAINLIFNLIKKYQNEPKIIMPHPMNYLFYKCYKLIAFWSIILDDWNTVNNYISKMIECHLFVFNNENDIDTSNLYSTKAIALENINRESESKLFWSKCFNIRKICCGSDHPLCYCIPFK